MKYTITGATGHLGRKVVEQLSRLVDIQTAQLWPSIRLARPRLFWIKAMKSLKAIIMMLNQ